MYLVPAGSFVGEGFLAFGVLHLLECDVVGRRLRVVSGILHRYCGIGGGRNAILLGECAVDARAAGVTGGVCGRATGGTARSAGERKAVIGEPLSLDCCGETRVFCERECCYRVEV